MSTPDLVFVPRLSPLTTGLFLTVLLRMELVLAKTSPTHKVKCLLSRTKGIDQSRIDHMTTSSETLDLTPLSRTPNQLMRIGPKAKDCRLLSLKASLIFLELLYRSRLDSPQAALRI